MSVSDRLQSYQAEKHELSDKLINSLRSMTDLPRQPQPQQSMRPPVAPRSSLDVVAVPDEEVEVPTEMSRTSARASFFVASSANSKEALSRTPMGGRSPSARGSPLGAPSPPGGSAGAEPLPIAPFSASGAGGTPAHQALLPAEAKIHVYHMRSVQYDQKTGRVDTSTIQPLSLGKTLINEALGIYHVGVTVRGVEYTFNMTRGLSSRKIGSVYSGVFAHEPRSAGPGNVFAHEHTLGTTTLTTEQVEAVAAEIGETLFQAKTYNRIKHNCGDFCRELSKRLRVDEPPSWCTRAADMARNFNLGGPAVDGIGDALDAEQEGGDSPQADGTYEVRPMILEGIQATYLPQAPWPDTSLSLMPLGMRPVLAPSPQHQVLEHAPGFFKEWNRGPQSKGRGVEVQVEVVSKAQLGDGFDDRRSLPAHLATM